MDRPKKTCKLRPVDGFVLIAAVLCCVGMFRMPDWSSRLPLLVCALTLAASVFVRQRAWRLVLAVVCLVLLGLALVL